MLSDFSGSTENVTAEPSGITLKGLNISKGAGKRLRRTVDVRTACIALEVDEGAGKHLHEMRRLYGQACSLLVPIVLADKSRKQRLWQRFNLHKAAYPVVRAKVPEIGSQLACNVMRSVSSAFKSWISNHPDFSKNKTKELPSISFSRPVVHLDKNTITFFDNYSRATVFTPAGRVTVKLCPGGYQERLLAGLKAESASGIEKDERIFKLGECNLVWKCGIKGKPSRWELHIAVEMKLKEVSLDNLKLDEVMGVDVGENNAGALSTGRIYKAGKMKDDRDKYLSSRKRFQRNGSRSAKQTLRQASGRERRHVEQINDEISKSVVEEAIKHKKRLIVLEDLTDIRSRIKAGLKVRARLHRWPFRQLQQKITDKAARAGIEVIFVNPRYTSKTCPRCNAIGTRHKHRFACKNCGYVAHSDLNGGRNLQRLGYLLISQGLA